MCIGHVYMYTHTHTYIYIERDIPGSSYGKEYACRQCGRPGFNSWVGKIPWSWKWQPTPAFLPGKTHGQRSLTGFSSWSCKESDVTEQLTLEKRQRNRFCKQTFWHMIKYSNVLWSFPNNKFQMCGRELLVVINSVRKIWGWGWGYLLSEENSIIQMWPCYYWHRLKKLGHYRLKDPHMC